MSTTWVLVIRALLQIGTLFFAQGHLLSVQPHEIPSKRIGENHALLTVTKQGVLEKRGCLGATRECHKPGMLPMATSTTETVHMSAMAATLMT